MTTATEPLYIELKTDVAALVEPLFELAENSLRKRGNFLPFAALLTESCEFRLVAAVPDSENDMTNSVEVLPVLHDAIRTAARELPTKAIGIAENVTITLDERRTTDAIKVLFEHRHGHNVALYLPFEKNLVQEFVFQAVFMLAAEPEVNAWTATFNS